MAAVARSGEMDEESVAQAETSALTSGGARNQSHENSGQAEGGPHKGRSSPTILTYLWPFFLVAAVVGLSVYLEMDGILAGLENVYLTK